ncbi:MAG: energy transducer TonB [Blastocatellia bacterium]
MFNKLIISATNRRRQRTANFFCGTAVFYLLSVAAAFAVSIIITNPKLADTSEHTALMITPTPLPVTGPQTVTNRGYSTVAPRNDPRQVTDLEKVMATTPGPVRTNAPVGPPGLGKVEAEGSVCTMSGLPIIYVPGSEGHGNPTALPDPPPPVAQVRPEGPRSVRLPSTVLQGKAVVRRTPDYPPLAKQIHLDGSVSVEVMISPDGRVESARAVSGHGLLKAAAVSAATGWRFQPTLLNGVAVQVTGVIVFNFKLNE